jgi:transposase
MTFIRHKKDKKGRKYAMEVESYWDKEKKQPRQRVIRYLGTVTEDGIKQRKPRQSPRRALDYGDCRVLNHIAEELHLMPVLENTFGLETARLIISLAMNKLIRETSYSNFHKWYEGSYLQHMAPVADPSSQGISRELERLGLDERATWRFFERWNTNLGVSPMMMYDISTFAAYSEMISLLEYGRDYQETGLKQVNLGLVCAADSGLPTYFKIFPGSLADVVTLDHVVDDLKCFGIKDTMFVLDRGFFRGGNIKKLVENKMKFIMPLPTSYTLYKNLIAKHRLKSESPENASMLNAKVIFHIAGDTEIEGVKVKYVHYFDPERKTREIENLYRRIQQVEEKINGTEFKGQSREQIFKDVPKDLISCFKMRIIDGLVHLERKKNAIARKANRKGKMILLFKGDLDWENLLITYRSRDRIEKMFSELKTDLSALPLRVHKESTLKGSMLISFVALILHSQLLRMMKESKLSANYSSDGLLLELSKIKMIEMTDGKLVLTEITKKCRTILERLGIKIDSA